MRILIDMGHPAHVHLFKHFIWLMKTRGHAIKVTARDKEVTKHLLEAYNIPYELVGGMREGRLNLYREWMGRGIQVCKIGREFHADIYLGMANPAPAMSARLNRKISVTLTDTEHAKLANSVTFPFTHTILTPSCYRDTIGKKQIRYNGYHELAYLHPNRFAPNPAVLTELGLAEGDPFIIVRFVSWQASHDVGQHGIRDRAGLVKALEQYGRVLITSEGALPPELQPYQIRVSPEKLHDLLYYATLLYGESATVASECAVLGTHAIFCDFAGRGYTDEEEREYDLVYNFKLDESSQEKSIEKAVELLQDRDLKEKGREKQKRLLNDKLDVTAFMVWFVENFPDSLSLMKTQPEIQQQVGCH